MHTPWRRARRLLSIASDFNPFFGCVTNMSRCAKYHTPGERRKCRCRVLSHSSQSKNARKTPWPPWDPRTPISDKLISFKDAESPRQWSYGSDRCASLYSPYYTLEPVHTCLYVWACRLVTGTSSRDQVENSERAAKKTTRCDKQYNPLRKKNKPCRVV